MFRLWGAALLLAVCLLIPAIINGQPIIYPDSIGYEHAGEAALRQVTPHQALATPAAPGSAPLAREDRDGISTARSVYYGLPLALLGVWGMAIGQALIAAWCLLLAAQQVLGPRLQIPSLLAIALISGLGFFASTIMPDVFTGLGILAASMLLAHGRNIPGWQREFWLGVVFIAGIVHKGNLAILALTVPFGHFWRGGRRDLGQIANVLVIALGAHLIVDMAVEHLTGKAPIGTPFVLARMIGDGTAVRYLREECPTRKFETCRFLDRFPMTENEFLWSRDPAKSVLGTADKSTRAAISSEASQIVLGTLAAYPLAQIKATAGNIARQFVAVGVTEFRFTVSATALANVSAIMLAVYIASLAGVAWQFRGAPSDQFAQILLLGLVMNAAVCGAISGVFDRYQGRVAWLALFAFATLLARQRRTA